MYHVLIADDEAIVRLMLSNMVDWEDMGLELAACVDNGREAMVYMEKHQVDLLITDISMPVVDGLALIEYAVQTESPPVILVLSAYHDFPYVRQAFKWGIYDYCLKRELQEELLRKHLENMKKLLEEKGRKGMTSAAFTGKEEDSTAGKKKGCLEMLLRRETEPEQAMLPERYYVVCISLLGYQRITEHFGRDLEREFYPALLKIADQIASLASHGVIGRWNLTNLVMVYGLQPGESQVDQLLFALGRLLKVWKNYMNVDAVAAVSRAAHGPEEFELCLEEANRNLTMKLVMKSRNLFSSEDTALFSPEKAEALKPEFQPVISALKRDDDLWMEKEKSAFVIRLREMKLLQAKEYVLCLAYEIAAELVHLLEDADYVYTTDIWKDISAFETNRELCIWTVNFLSDMRRYVRSRYQFHYPDEIQRALDYLRDHYYRTDLTLYEVASQVGFSEKYFSSLFGREVGVSFSGYLKKIRIEHAKHMLAETDMKLKEICDAVGYNSVEYFIRVFSTGTGMSPSAYRKHTKGKGR